MTDNEIIETLEICSNIVTSSCRECRLHSMYNANCVVQVMRNALDLINRQKAEVEVLKDDVDFLDRHNDELIREIERLQEANESFSCMGKMYSEIKSEARKELWEQIKAMYGLDEKDIIVAVNIKEIDNLLAEMESERK